MVTFCLSKEEYESIKNGKELLICVTAKGEHPVYAEISAYPNKKSNSCNSDYENAVFNGEQ